MERRDARVDYGDTDARAGITHQVDNGARSNRDRGAAIGTLGFAILDHSLDARVSGELLEQAIGNAKDATVEARQLSTRSTVAAKQRQVVAAVVQFDDDVRLARLRRALAQALIELAV